MPRELEINNASQDYIITEYNHKYIIFRKDVKSSFESGAKWADENPKSPWISVEDDLPCNHEELLKSQESYRTKSVIVRFDNNLHGFAYMVKICNKWKWFNGIKGITHWMPIPKLPKE